MLRGVLIGAGAIVLAVAVGGWIAVAPRPMAEADLAGHVPDAENGRYVYFAAGCASCHATPGEGDPLLLGGGLELKTPFGTFVAPNISPDPGAGIGGWSELDFANAMIRGVSPEGRHYYPAFPYTSYQRMRMEDVMDLKAFIDTLEPVAAAAPPHDLSFPFNVRAGIGLWKLAYLDGEPFRPDPALSEEENRGAYLVEGPAHCGECHTPRDRFGGMDPERRLAGGPAPEGEGRIPNITPHADGIADWSRADIAYALETGFTPDFDSFGGAMARVVRNTRELTREDREAIAAYLATVPALPRGE